MRTSVVMLDAGNTLFVERLGRDELYTRALSDLGLPVDVMRVARLRVAVHDAMPEQVDGRPRYSEPWFQEYMRRLVTELGGGIDPERVRRRLADDFSRPDTYVLFADTLDALEDLTERGLRLALVSNWSRQLRALLDGLGLSRFFEVTVISEEAGLSKPDPGIYRTALEQLDVSAGHAVHVGDHPLNDLAAARRAGLRALLLDRHGEHGHDEAAIPSLREIVPRLD